jgi:predicted dehydrogenase
MSRNIALVGCGAIAHQFHLTALANHRHDFNNVWVIDPSAVARQMACSIVAAQQSAALVDVADDLQFVIVASPNINHFTAAREALLRDAHVLIEKPFAIWPDEGRELVKLASERNRVIAVNQTRRFFPYSQQLRNRISAGEFGAIKRIVHNEGEKLPWRFLSGAAFAKNAQRTGVIMDMGVHVLDFYQYLLNPAWVYGWAIHDGFRGPEGLAELYLEANNAPVSIKLSRYQKQENFAHLDFENAWVQIDISKQNAYSVKSKSDRRKRQFVPQSPPVDLAFLSDSILSNFIGAATDREKVICEARSSLPVINILDEIYRCAKHYPETPGKV